MKVLVTGALGQLGYDVMLALKKKGIEAYGTDLKAECPFFDNYFKCDLTNDEDVKQMIISNHFDAIIHCAGWTEVDAAEDIDNQKKVENINYDATKKLVDLSKILNIKFLFISSDYVFNGKGNKPWDADNECYEPLNFYGLTKAKAEQYIKSTSENYFIVRISWVFGKNGKNFVKTMLNLANKGYKEINVVDDQIGLPTYSYDVAKLLVEMILTDKYGTYNATNSGDYISWASFAEEIFLQTNKSIKVNHLATEEYGLSKAKRPFNSRLDLNKLKNNGFDFLPHWKNALKRYLEEIL